MTKIELEKYLEVRTVLDLKGVKLDKEGWLDCPLHSGCKKSLKVYEELNSVACLRESCSKYRQVFGVLELLQELEGCDGRQVVLLGKSLLLKELEQYRAIKEPKEVRAEEGLSEGVKAFLEQLQGSVNNQEFTKSGLQKQLRLAMPQSTLTLYFRQLIKQNYIEIVKGSRYRGFTYRLK